LIPSPLLVVTDRHGSARPLVETVRAVLDGGARWIWFRDKDLESGARRDLALELLALVHDAGGQLTMGGDAVLAAEIGADGVHLGVRRLELDPYRRAHSKLSEDAAQRHLRIGEREGAPPLLGISAHSLGDIRQAAQAGANYATLSPIFSSTSKPGYGPALGLETVSDAATLGLPIVALGGIATEHAVACREAGAAGVAVMGGIMRAADPAGETRRYLLALGATT
jgi:thiamine-phosphate pyrophosphorylase